MEFETSLRPAARVLGDEHPAAPILELTDRDAFMRSVRRAEEEAVRAVAAFDELALWMKRLQPYFDRDPQLTVARALQLYLEAKNEKAGKRAAELS